MSTSDARHRGRIALPSTGDTAWMVLAQASAVFRDFAIERSVDGSR